MLESFFNFLVNLTKSIFTFFKILVRSKFFLPKHQAENQEVIVLGNGPSLKKVLAEHLEDLKTQTLLCVNKFPDTPNFEILQPRYFLFTATGYFKPEKVKHEQETREKVLDALINKTNWPITLFCPALAKDHPQFIQRIQQNKNIEICFFNNTPVEGLSSINHVFMANGWAMPRPHNVLIPSIQVLINSGFKNIYVVGADHSWLPLVSVDEQNNALINQQHFYDDHKDNTGHMYRNSKPRRLHEILEKFMLSFRAYFDLKAYAQTRGVNVFNCTPGSFIDAFDRKDISSVLSKSSQNQNTLASKSKSSE